MAPMTDEICCISAVHTGHRQGNPVLPRSIGAFFLMGLLFSGGGTALEDGTADMASG